jgi:outer membrane cobalamin receptor
MTWNPNPLLLCGLLWTIAAASPAQTAAQDGPDDEDLRTFYATATVQERAVEDAGSSLTVIDRAEIEASGARTVAEVLRWAPGVDVVPSGGRGGFTNAAIRGGDPNFTFVLLDGVPLNDVTDVQGGAVNLESLPAAMVERVEIVRGPLSSFYGSTGLAGVIHLFSRRGADGTGVEAEIEGGDADLLRAAVSAGGAFGGGGDYFVGGSWDEESERVAGESFEQGSVHAGFGIPLSERSLLRLGTRLSRWDADDYPEASGGPRYGSGELRASEHDEASFSAELLFGSPVGEAGSRRHRLGATWYRHDLERSSPGVFPDVPPSVEHTDYRRSGLRWSSTFLDRGGLSLAGGLDVENERGVNDSVLLLPPIFGGMVPGDYSVDRTQGGAFGELIRARGHGVLELGLRVDAVEGQGPEVSPRLAYSYRPGGGATRIRASLGRAFKLPSFFALASPPALGGNPDLLPETSLGGDLGVEHVFRDADATLGLTWFKNRFEDLVDFDFVDFTHVNRSRVDVEGVELSFAWHPGPVRLAGDVTWQEVVDAESGEDLGQRPEWKGSLRLAWRPVDAFSLWIEATSSSRLPDTQLPVPEIRYADGYGKLDVAASWRLAPHWELRARVDNVLDESYETRIGFPGPSRGGRLALRYRMRSAESSTRR